MELREFILFVGSGDASAQDSASASASTSMSKSVPGFDTSIPLLFQPNPTLTRQHSDPGLKRNQPKPSRQDITRSAFTNHIPLGSPASPISSSLPSSSHMPPPPPPSHARTDTGGPGGTLKRRKSAVELGLESLGRQKKEPEPSKRPHPTGRDSAEARKKKRRYSADVKKEATEDVLGDLLEKMHCAL